MTSLLHRSNGDFADFDYRRQLAELDYVTTSTRGNDGAWLKTMWGYRSIFRCRKSKATLAARAMES